MTSSCGAVICMSCKGSSERELSWRHCAWIIEAPSSKNPISQNGLGRDKGLKRDDQFVPCLRRRCIQKAVPLLK